MREEKMWIFVTGRNCPFRQKPKKKVNFHSNKNSNYTTRQDTSTVTETEQSHQSLKHTGTKTRAEETNKKKAKRMKKVGRLPAAQACGLTETWPVEEEEHNWADWTQPSAPDTTVLNLTWIAEACCLQTERSSMTGDGKKEKLIRRNPKTVGGSENMVWLNSKSCRKK